MNTKHTPGPWSLDWETGHVTSPHVETAGRIVCTMPGTIGEGYREGNARLISAAPELLAALREMIEQFGHYCEHTEDSKEIAAQSLARAAISKAEGHA